MSKGQTADLILEAGVQCIAQAGPEGASVRAIAERAGVPAPTLQHHFRAKADLLDAVYTAALERHLSDTCGVLGALTGGLPLVPAGAQGGAARRIMLGGSVAMLGEAWLEHGGAADRTAAMLHLLVHAVRDPAYASLAGQWLAGVERALRDVLGLDADEAAFACEALVGLVLASGPHAFRRESALLNRDVLTYAFGPRGGLLPGVWLSHFRGLYRAALAEAGPQMGDGTAAVPGGIVDAGVVLAAEAGADALSVRKLAARAGVAPSSVLYHFPDRQALLTALYRGVHRRFMASDLLEEQAQWPPLSDSDGNPGLVSMFTHMITGQVAGSVPLFLTSCELFLVGWREPDLAGQAFAMRLERGCYGAGSADEQGDRGLLTHLHSLWSMGLALTVFARGSAHRAERVAERLRAGMAVIAGGHGGGGCKVRASGA